MKVKWTINFKNCIFHTHTGGVCVTTVLETRFIWLNVKITRVINFLKLLNARDVINFGQVLRKVDFCEYMRA